jgi:hypothetical protein
MGRSIFSAERSASSFWKEERRRISPDCPLLCAKKRVFVEDKVWVILWTQTPYLAILRLIEGLLHAEPNSPWRFLIVCIQEAVDDLKNHLELLIVPALHIFNLFFRLLTICLPENIISDTPLLTK